MVSVINKEMYANICCWKYVIFDNKYYFFFQGQLLYYNALTLNQFLWPYAYVNFLTPSWGKTVKKLGKIIVLKRWYKWTYWLYWKD